MGPARTAVMFSADSKETYTLYYPENLLGFCRYDFTKFKNRCLELCEQCEDAGRYYPDKAKSIADGISGCHCFYAHNRDIFGDIALDFMIFCLCGNSNISYEEMRRELVHFENDFEKVMYARLSEYRFGKGINGWELLSLAQEYARKKLGFICSGFASAEESDARRNYFDSVFAAAASDSEHYPDEFASVRFSRMGRLGIKDGEGDPRKRPDPKFDAAAMDIFRKIADDKRLENAPKKGMKAVYPKAMYCPESLFAAIDLELDLLADSGMLLRRCTGCGKFYLYGGGEERCKHCGIKPGAANDPVIKKLARTFAKVQRQVGKNVTEQEFLKWREVYDNMLAGAEQGIANPHELAAFSFMSDRLCDKGGNSH